MSFFLGNDNWARQARWGMLTGQWYLWTDSGGIAWISVSQPFKP